MNSGEVSIELVGGGSFNAYVAEPAAASAPGLVLMQYICGVNRVMRRLADEFAAHGYLVAVPDLFWRQEPGVALNDDPANPDPAHNQRAVALNDGFDDERAIDDLAVVLSHLRKHSGCDGRVGALGYCLGGRMAYLMATRTDVDCAVGYYGVNIEHYLSEASSISCPLLLHVAGEDALVPEPVRSRITEVLDEIDNVELVTHPGVNHAFALEGGANYAPKVAETANAISNDFLDRCLNQDGRRVLRR